MSKQLLAEFYDIESLRNIFTLCNFKEHTNSVDVYILDDSGIVDLRQQAVCDFIISKIREKNKQFKGTVSFYDLHQLPAAVHLVNALGASDEEIFSYDTVKSNTFSNIPGYQPFVKDTDEGYDEEKYPYVFGYNSFNYDDTILALFHHECFRQPYPDGPVMFSPPTASVMRDYNNMLFTPEFKNKMPDFLRQEGYHRAQMIKKSMEFSGRHIDVARLNEKSGHMALKRVSGMLGFQILESDKLSNNDFINNLEEIAELLAYNISDCIQLRNVFYHKQYKNTFDLKRGLLKSYPELIYMRKRDTNPDGSLIFENGKPKLLYKPDISPNTVARNRLYIDSSSSKLAARALCPYGELDDIAAVSFLYPSEKQALENDIPRVNVLEECRMFFYNLYTDPKTRAEWDRIYNYYKAIEGRNFNEADNYNNLYNAPAAWSNPQKARVMLEYRRYLEDYDLCRRQFQDINKLLQAGIWKSPKTGVSYKPSAFMDKDEWKFDSLLRDYNLAIQTFQTPQRMFSCRLWTSPISGRIYQPSDFARNLQWKHHSEMYYPLSTLYNIKDIPKSDTNLLYFRKDCSPSSCYVTFSTGGIHGAEYNKALYEHELRQYEILEQDMQLCMQTFPNPCDFKKAKAWISPVTNKRYTCSEFLKSGATLKKAEWKDISKKKPSLFKWKSDTCKLNERYVFTSSSLSTHEDFESYYPSMLIEMSAFWNDGLGYDRYKEIFGNKREYGKLMKDKSLSQSERDNYAVLREGTKLILNSASGAGDANFYTPIRMNNNIMSMRLIGQLFTWRIGQAQTYEGATIISTNTDGLYSVMEEELNNKILAREAANIHVNIAPEPCYLISKDSNNRIEENSKHEVLAANGGSLACRMGPRPDKSLAHPAIIDWALAEYIRNADNIHTSPDFMSEDFDDRIGLAILEKAKSEFEPRKYLQMFQNVIASSIGKMTYNFAVDKYGGKKILQHYNRVFMVKPDTSFVPTYHLAAVWTKTISPATKLKRSNNHERAVQHDAQALTLLSAYGIPESEIPANKEAAIKKITNVAYTDYAIIDNRALEDIPDTEVMIMIDSLDISVYLTLVRKTFDNWRNVLPGATVSVKAANPDEDEDEPVNIDT